MVISNTGRGVFPALSLSIQERGRKMKAKQILVVEDDAFSRRAMEKVLECYNYDTFSCATAEEAIIKLQEETFGILITDLQMGGMDGLELIRETRRIHPEIPAILMTGLATEEIKLRAKKEGVNGFFPKPIEWDELVALLEVLTKTGRSKNQNIPKGNERRSYPSLQRRIFTILTLSLLTLFNIQIPEAQERFPKLDRPPLRMDSQRCWKTPSVGLTEEQIKALENHQRSYQAETTPKYREIMALRLELQCYVSDKNTKPQDLMERHKKLLSLQTELETISFSYQMKARSILTKEQLERLPQDCLLEMGIGYGAGVGIGRGQRRGYRW
ncbi:MAG: response regulator [Deltaproteobacteria bacterium]|nr:MAG: response regulator [Deltaproteobacteria bacterium]